MKQTVVMFPGGAMGHLNPMVELAKLFSAAGFSVSIVIVEDPFNPAPTIASNPSRISSEYPSISFHQLSSPPPPRPNCDPFLNLFDLHRWATPQVRDLLTSLSQAVDVRALVLGVFCTDALDAAAELNIPSYFYWPSSASNLAHALYLPVLESQTDASFKDLGEEAVIVPGVQPVPASHMPLPLQDRSSDIYRCVAGHLERLREADGIVVNTFDLLEERAVRALVDGLCVPPGQRMPTMYCIGPLGGRGGSSPREDECLKWLDKQPRGSVVFLCFGSMGSFTGEQLKEIAAGLERSGQRFVWVVRNPSDDPAERKLEPDLSALLPEGFLERTEGRGVVVKLWAPQTAVLAHEAVGGFVSHCGWNSTTEAVSAGVPLIAWPLYGEQRINKLFLVEEVRLAVEMVKGEELVSAEEVEAKLRWLMESEQGSELKRRAAAMKETASAARNNGGSSEKAWKELVGVLTKESN